MKPTIRLVLAFWGSTLLAVPACAQIPDLLNALDAGGRAMAMGGANNATNVDTLATYYNPAALAYLDTKAVGLVYRNLPRSRTTLSGDRSDFDQSTDGQSGGQTITHAGFAAPVRELLGRGSGTIGISYTVGGYTDDVATATTLTHDALTQSDELADEGGRMGADGRHEFEMGAPFFEQKRRCAGCSQGFGGEG